MNKRNWIQEVILFGREAYLFDSNACSLWKLIWAQVELLTNLLSKELPGTEPGELSVFFAEDSRQLEYTDLLKCDHFYVVALNTKGNVDLSYEVYPENLTLRFAKACKVPVIRLVCTLVSRHSVRTLVMEACVPSQIPKKLFSKGCSLWEARSGYRTSSLVFLVEHWYPLHL